MSISADFSKLVSHLMHSRNQAHVYHLQTKSFAEHMALNGYYDNIIDLVDGLMESYQGKYGIIEKYTSFELNSYKSNKETINYFTALQKNVDSLREDVDDSYIQNQIDTVTELIQSTIYKLSYLA
jgi:hypothetical protein